MSARKLFETKDSSINISLDTDWCRWILGVAFTNSDGEAATMRMVAVHLGPMCFAFTSFTFRSRRPVKGKKRKTKLRKVK